MTPDNATQCDSRHGKERCRKAAHHAPADPWHESLNHVWQRVSLAGALSFAPPETVEDLRAQRDEARATARELCWLLDNARLAQRPATLTAKIMATMAGWGS